MQKQKTKFKQTEIGKIPEDWEEKELKELGEVATGKGTEKLEKGKYKIIGSNGFLGYTNEENFLVEGPLIFTGRVGTIGQINFLKKEKVRLSDNALYFTTKYENLLKYVYYFLKNTNFSFLNVGSTQPLVKQSDFKKIKIILPPLPEQHSIAKILSSLDAKIELNNKTNKTLEAVGQTLFKKWFLENEGREGWEEGKLGDLIDNIKETLKAGEEIKERKYVPIDLLSMNKISIDSFLPYTEAKSGLIGFEKDDILLGAMRVYFHRVNLAPFSGVTRTTTFVLRPKNKEHLAYCLFLLNQNETIDFANANSKGSTMPYAVWNDSLENMPIIIPDDKTIKEFNKLVYPLLSKIRDTIFQNQTPSQIRDTLLSKLMNGEIRVK